LYPCFTTLVHQDFRLNVRAVTKPIRPTKYNSAVTQNPQMAPSFILTRLAPCAGTPVHTLACGHTIHASFLHPTTSSKCAPNCKAVNMITSAEPPFKCPQCYSAYLSTKYSEFVRRAEKNSKLDGLPIDIIVKQVKGRYDSGVKGEKGVKGEYDRWYDRWYDVWLGETTFEKMGRDSYKWSLRKTGQRGCKAVGTVEVEEGEGSE
jgi:hypothetical protein